MRLEEWNESMPGSILRDGRARARPPQDEADIWSPPNMSRGSEATASLENPSRMSEDIPFNRTLNLAPGVVDSVAPGVRRILADNPGPFTFKGTLSYIVGRGKVAIIDPGPLDGRHTAALLDAVRGETVTHIIITHTHRDHSQRAAPLKALTGAKTFGEGPHRRMVAVRMGD